MEYDRGDSFYDAVTDSIYDHIPVQVNRKSVIISVFFLGFLFFFISCVMKLSLEIISFLGFSWNFVRHMCVTKLLHIKMKDKIITDFRSFLSDEIIRAEVHGKIFFLVYLMV